MSRRFSILQVLGAGAQSVVCVATDHHREKSVALKVVRQDQRHVPQTIDRVRDEGRILAQLQHPNIPRVLETLDYNGIPVLVMEYAEGIALPVLSRAQAGHAIPVPVAVAMGHDVAGALDYAWSSVGPDGAPMRVVHRDVKPDNILLDPSGRIRLMDFGIATGTFEGREAKSLFLVHSTQGYEAPERRFGQPDDHKVDVYGLGATLLELLTGHTPVLSRKPERHVEAVASHLEQIPDAGQGTLLRDTLQAMLAYEPEDRPTMAEARRAFTALLPEGGSPLPAFAAEHLPALMQVRAHDRPEDHEAWPDLVMLHQADPTAREASMSVPEATEALREILSQDNWESRVGEIKAIQQRAPFFVTHPLLEVLERADPPWYRFWVTRARPSELEQALVLLCDHANPTVRRMALQLQSHPDKRVAAAASFVLSHTGRGAHED